MPPPPAGSRRGTLLVLLLGVAPSPTSARDVGRRQLWSLLADAPGFALNFTHNDTIVEFGLDPSRPGNVSLEPAALFEPLLPALALPTGPLPARAAGGGGALRRGPMLGLNRSVEICEASGRWAERCSGERGLPTCRTTSPDSLWVTPQIRVPVALVFSWLRHDTRREYCWSVRQAQPDALAALPLAELEALASHVLSGLEGAKGAAAGDLAACGGRAFCTSVDLSSPLEVSFVGMPAAAAAAAAATAGGSTSSASSPSVAVPLCAPGSVRVRLTEWSFPSFNFSILARLAMDDDAWVSAARALAAAAHVESADRPVDSGFQVAHKDIVPGKVNFTETARDQPTYWAWANDSHWMPQAVLKVFGKTVWETRVRFYPAPRPSLHEFIARYRPAGRGPETWQLVHWHPGWMKDDIELVRRGSIGVSPPLTSYVLTQRPPTNALHALLGDTWGTLLFIVTALIIVLALAGLQCCLERKPAPTRRGGSSSALGAGGTALASALQATSPVLSPALENDLPRGTPLRRRRP